MGQPQDAATVRSELHAHALAQSTKASELMVGQQFHVV